MDILGALVCVLLFVTFLLPYRYTFALLLLFCPFMVSGVAHIGSKILQPYLFCEFGLIIRSLIETGNISCGKTKKILKYILFFFSYAFIITLLGPNIFEGIKVVDKNLDESFYCGYKKLAFSLDNITQIGYLVLNLTTLVCIKIHAKKIPTNFLRNSYLLSVVVCVFLGYWEFLSKISGYWFPYEFLMTGRESGMYMATVMGHFRMSSLCTEASTFGAFIASSFWAVFTMKKKNMYYILLILIFGSIVLSMSGTAYVAFGVGFLILFYYRGGSPNLMIGLSVVFLAIIFSFFYSDYFKDMIFMLSDKSESSSGQVRLSTALRSMQIFIESFGLGIGLGSTRSSSFLMDMLAQVGLVGSLFFAFLFISLLEDIKKRKSLSWLSYYVLVLMFAQTIAVPDFSFGLFWMGLFMMACCHDNMRIPFIKRRMIYSANCDSE